MGYLDRFKKESVEQEETTHVGGRVPKSIADDFRKYCTELNLTLSDGLRLLMEKELRENAQGGAAAQDSRLAAAELNANKPLDGRKKPFNADRTKVGELYDFIRHIDGKKQLPCPVCGTWSAYAVFSKRHSAKHGYTTSKEMFFDEKHAAKLAEMLQEKDAQLVGQ